MQLDQHARQVVVRIDERRFLKQRACSLQKRRVGLLCLERMRGSIPF
jgi:hypothetical protein